MAQAGRSLGVSYPVGLITPPTNDDLANALVGSTALDSIESPTHPPPGARPGPSVG